MSQPGFFDLDERYARLNERDLGGCQATYRLISVRPRFCNHLTFSVFYLLE